MVKKITIIALVSLFAYICAYGKPIENRLFLSGKIASNAPKIKSIKFEFYKHYSQYLDGIECTTKTVFPYKGKFFYASPAYDDMAYLKIKIELENYFYLSKEVYPVAVGDKLSLTIDSNSFSFSGSGAEKYNFVSQCSEIKVVLDQPFDSTDKRMMSYIFDRFEDTYKKREEKLKQLTNLSDYDKKLLAFNLRAQEGLEYNENIARQIASSNNDIITRVFRPNVLAANSYLSLQLTDSTLASKSPYYFDYVFKTVQTRINLDYLPSPQSPFRTNFNVLFNTILKNYEGQTLFALLTRSITASIPKDSTDYYLNYALREIPVTDYNNSIILSIKNKFGKGASIPENALIDTSDQKFMFKNLKGRVVILDFWFTGCTGCKQLASAMDTVHTLFDNDANVAFVSVCIDRSKSEWKKSLATGQYSKNSIDVYTNGLAENHPLIKHFGFNSFPQLLLIGKDGRIFFADPPRPSRQQATKRFIEIVNSAI